MLIVFVGPPGVGKGTQCSLLSNKLQIPHLSSGHLLRAAIAQGNELGEIAKRYIDRGQLLPDDVMVDLIDDELDHDRYRDGCLLDGFPRTLVQAEAFDLVLAKEDRKLSVVVELVVDNTAIMERLKARARSQARSDDEPETVVRRLKVYLDQTAPIVEYYERDNRLRKVDGVGAIEVVHDRIMDVIGSAGQIG